MQETACVDAQEGGLECLDKIQPIKQTDALMFLTLESCFLYNTSSFMILINTNW